MFEKNYAHYYDLFNKKKQYKKEVEFVYKWAGKPERILDIGCGAAHYWKYFPKKSDMVGIEKSKSMISLSKYKNEIINYDIREGIFARTGVFDCAVALFNVINYIPSHDWWWGLKVMPGGYFIFDIWDKEKVEKDGFEITEKCFGDQARVIIPRNYTGKSIDLRVVVLDGQMRFEELHRMYIYSHEDIVKFCGNDFEIVEVKPTRKWQTWYKLRKK